MKANLKDYEINIRIKLAVLWTSLMFLYLYGDYFELYTPAKVQHLLNGTAGLDKPAMLFLASVMLAIPALMIALNIFLKPIMCRWLNIIFGILYTIVMILIGSTSLHTWYEFYVFYAILEVIITLMITWVAWNWPGEGDI